MFRAQCFGMVPEIERTTNYLERYEIQPKFSAPRKAILEESAGAPKFSFQH